MFQSEISSCGCSSLLLQHHSHIVFPLPFYQPCQTFCPPVLRFGETAKSGIHVSNVDMLLFTKLSLLKLCAMTLTLSRNAHAITKRIEGYTLCSQNGLHLHTFSSCSHLISCLASISLANSKCCACYEHAGHALGLKHDDWKVIPVFTKVQRISASLEIRWSGCSKR